MRGKPGLIVVKGKAYFHIFHVVDGKLTNLDRNNFNRNLELKGLVPLPSGK